MLLELFVRLNQSNKILIDQIKDRKKTYEEISHNHLYGQLDQNLDYLLVDAKIEFFELSLTEK